jgi:hypothetical protein
MQRLQGWVRYAAQQLPAGGSSKAGQQQQGEDEEEADFIYGRLQVHSDDEEHGEQQVVMPPGCWVHSLTDQHSHTLREGVAPPTKIVPLSSSTHIHNCLLPVQTTTTPAGTSTSTNSSSSSSGGG